MLRFYARDGHVCPWPGQRSSGQLRRYIGRKNKIERNHRGEVTMIGHPATEEATEIDPQSAAGRRVLRLMLIEEKGEHPLWPADEATAKACGVPFTRTVFSDGEYRAAPAGKKSSSSRGGSSNQKTEGDDQ